MTETMCLAKIIDASLSSTGLIVDLPVPFFFDNKLAIKLIHLFSGTKLRKTIRILHHYLQQETVDARFQVQHIPSHLQKADIMT